MAQKEKVFWDSDTFSWDEKEMIDNYREAFNINEKEQVDMDKVQHKLDVGMEHLMEVRWFMV